MKKLITLFTVLLLITSSTPVQAQAVTAYNSTSERVAGGVCIDLTENLSIADKGTKVSPVLKLQSFLYPKYLNEPPTGYFGVLTDAAVKKFQAEYPNEIETPTGYVGPLTRNIIKSLTCGGTSQTTTGTKAGTASGPVSTLPSYSSSGWWLAPAATSGSGNNLNEPVKPNNTTTTNNNQNNNQTPPATTTGPHAPLVDINATPSNVSLDANGWPKYLNVPADCPAADRSKFYIHHWKGMAAPGNGAPRVSYESGNRFFATKGYINIASDEVFAIPFFVPHGISGGSSELRIGAMGDSFSGEITQYPETGPTQSVSRCPGQFGDEGSVKLNVVSPIEEGIKVYGRFATTEGQDVTMKPGHWYFFNMADTQGYCEAQVSHQAELLRTIASGAGTGSGGGLVPGGGLVSPFGTSGSSFGDPGPRYVVSYNERGKPVCSLLEPAYWGGALPAHIAPWTNNHGGGKTGAGKTYFPPNYKGAPEYRSAIPATFRTITRCYDATKRLPMAEMITENSLGSLPRQIKALGTSWNTYACETETVGITQSCPTFSNPRPGVSNPPCRDISEPVPVEKWVCAAHREGQTRQLVITYAPAIPMAVEECKWNEDRKAYAWYATYAPNYIGTEGTPNWGTYVKWIEGGAPIR